MKQLRKIVAIVVIGAILLFARTGYLVVRPGSAEELSRFITVESGENDHAGAFYLVTVSQQKASPLLMLYALTDPYIELQSSRRVIPPNMDPQEYNELMQRYMEESQNLAKVIALRRAGVDVPIESDGVEVVEVGEDSPAEGILVPGDIIVGVDGIPVYLAEELITQVQLRSIGDAVTLTVKRNEQIMDVFVDTASHTEQPDKAALRVLIQTHNWHPVLPVDITIEVGEISGPSAGLMFVLEIINQLDPRDLTAGQKIAGTGTINLQEEVGSIGGVRQKVKAAEEAGATYFISPLDNYEDAKAAANSITVVQVNTLDEVLIFLEDLMQK